MPLLQVNQALHASQLQVAAVPLPVITSYHQAPTSLVRLDVAGKGNTHEIHCLDREKRKFIYCHAAVVLLPHVCDWLQCFSHRF